VNTKPVIAIDGPGGSGKSTVSRAVADRLGWAHLDTGAFYRTATLIVLEAEVDVTDEKGILDILEGKRFDQERGVMRVDGRDVSAAIRSDDVTHAVSAVSAHPQVRKVMVSMQRVWAERHPGAVVEGRDIGTVVFPHALLKVFLTADPAERARRRAGETGNDSGEVAAALERRDALDSTRTTSPLKPADDAWVIDTTDIGIEEVVQSIVDRIPASA
jgi:cytidylate kinase